MKNFTKILGAVIALSTLVLQTPAAAQAVGGFFSAHPNISILLGGISSILALFHNPNQTA